MNPSEIGAVALELCDLLQVQLDSIKGRKSADFTPEESDVYRKRKSRIAELRFQLRQAAKLG